MKDEYLVAITYIQDGAQGNELALSIEGWRAHFKEQFRIVVFGDKPTVDGVEWIPIERVPGKEGEYRPALDVNTKLRAICLYCLEHRIPGFIWAADDYFAVNDFTIRDIMLPVYADDELPSKWDKSQNDYWHEQIKTRRLCEREGYETVNWSTHLPKWFDPILLLRVIDDYDLTETGYIIENIYSNKYTTRYPRTKLSKDKDRFKFPVWYPELDREGFRNALKNKIWVCCSVHGWSEELENELKKHYEQCHLTK